MKLRGPYPRFTRAGHAQQQLLTTLAHSLHILGIILSHYAHCRLADERQRIPDVIAAVGSTSRLPVNRLLPSLNPGGKFPNIECASFPCLSRLSLSFYFTFKSCFISYLNFHRSTIPAWLPNARRLLKSRMLSPLR